MKEMFELKRSRITSSSSKKAPYVINTTPKSNQLSVQYTASGAIKRGCGCGGRKKAK